jgi:hypothetical protein
MAMITMVSVMFVRVMMVMLVTMDVPLRLVCRAAAAILTHVN